MLDDYQFATISGFALLVLSVFIALFVAPVLALPTALGLSRKRTFGQRYCRGYVANGAGASAFILIRYVDPPIEMALVVYGLTVLVVLLAWGESWIYAIIGLLAPAGVMYTTFTLVGLIATMLVFKPY